MTTISVVIPAKDDGEMLRRCLVALCSQTRPADEIIVVDNASSDDTRAVASRFGATLLTESQPGITATASHGYDRATGEVIARCDADSLVPSDWLAHIEMTFNEHPHIVAATGPATFYDLSRFGGWAARVFYLDLYFILAGAAVANVPLFGSNFAMRRSLWSEVGPTVPRDVPDIHDDFDLSYRIPPARRVYFDRAMRVAISGRPFTSMTAMRHRIWVGFRTVREHFPDDLPHRRWASRLRARRHVTR